jgi:RimJ/RimL family protein N-acetyltransferase
MLKGSKVIIGPFLAGDVDALFRWLNDPEAARMDLAYRPTDWVAFKNWTEAISKDPSRVLFAVRRIGEAPIIGFVGLSAIHAVHRSADLGIRIGDESNRNQGLGKEAVRLVVDFGWRHLNLNRISLTTLADNPRAIKAFASVGFVQEGIARRAWFLDGAWHDLVNMAALRPTPA